VLQSPFTSLESIASANYRWLPVHFLIKDHFDSLSKITHINTPLLLFHGEDDGVVPIAEGKLLFDRAPSPKESAYFPGRGHNDLDLDALTDRLLLFCHNHALIKTP
jgi:fermentation-respiration switch protein FrsA (DUF1100 family)